MAITSISFANYRAFSRSQRLDLAPITVVLGKNNSGKSAVARLPAILSTGFQTDSPTPFDFESLGEDIAGSFLDLIHGRRPHGALDLAIQLEGGGQAGGMVGAQIQNIDELQLQVVSSVSIKSDVVSASFHWELEAARSSSRPYVIRVPDAEPIVAPVDFLGLLPSSFPGSEDTGPGRGGVSPLAELLRQISLLRSAFDEIAYIGPFREQPKRLYRMPGRTPGKMDATGDAAPALLAVDNLRGDGQLLDHVNEFIRSTIGDWELHVRSRDTMYELELTSIHDSSINVNLADTGSGVAQVVPLVVQEAMHVVSPVIRPTVYVIEQPELHLHPAAHAALAELFFKGLSANRRFLIETHSENLILRLRRYVADQELKASDLALYFVDQSRGAATLRRIEVDDLGNVQDWPTGVFSEDLAQTKKLLRAQLAQAAD